MRKIEEIQLERARMKQQKYREAHRADEWEAKFNKFLKDERAKKEERLKAELEAKKAEVSASTVVESAEPAPEVVEKPKKSKKKKTDVDVTESSLGQVPTSKVEDSLV